MSKLYSSNQVVKALHKKGFVFVSQKGSHVKYRRISEKTVLTVIVPADRKEIPHGTCRSILRQASLNIDDFKKKK